jgi:hypothetical protein
VRRIAAKRARPFDLAAEELLVSQDEDVPTRKKSRLEEPISTTTDQAARKTPGATPATGSWTLEEDAKLTRAMENTCKKEHGSEYKTDWVSVAALVPGRTNIQCWNRWHTASGRKGKWTAVEDSKLKDAVQTHGDKEWGAIAALVPSRTQKQCWQRWNDVLDPNIGRASGRKGKWTAVEDSKLKDAVQTHGGKDWVAISLLVPGRTRSQCWSRWKDALNPSMSLTAGRTGAWEEDEDIKLKDAVQTQGEKDWVAISALVPGRTRSQCNNRWRAVLDANNIGRASRHKCKRIAVDDSKLKHAVQTQGDKGWAAVSALVPGRTGKQCNTRRRLKKKYKDPNRTTVSEKHHGTLKKAPAVGQNPHSP